MASYQHVCLDICPRQPYLIGSYYAGLKRRQIQFKNRN